MTKSLILPSSLPDLSELCRQQLPEKRPDADVREVITVSPNRAPAGGIISVLGMIERLFHEPGKRTGSAIPNLRSNKLDQSGDFPFACSTFNPLYAQSFDVATLDPRRN